MNKTPPPDDCRSLPAVAASEVLADRRLELARDLAILIRRKLRQKAAQPDGASKIGSQLESNTTGGS